MLRGMKWIITVTILLNSSYCLKGKVLCPLDYNGKDILLPHTTDCTKYIQCENGRSFERNCPQGFYFNADKNLCDESWNVNCGITSTSTPIITSTETYTTVKNESEDGVGWNGDGSPNNTAVEKFECPLQYNGEDVLFPHPNECTKYLQCDHGQPVERLCPPELYFNGDLNACDWPWNVNCSVSITSTETYTTVRNESEDGAGWKGDESHNNTTGEKLECPLQYNGEDVLFSHPTECTRYLQCDHGQPVERFCPAGLYFNVDLNVCDWPWNVNCTAISTTTAFETTVDHSPDKNETEDGLGSSDKQFVCPYEYNGIDVLLPHPTDCAKYLQCDQGQPFERSCPAGFYFNADLNVCDWPWNVNCTAISITPAFETTTKKQNSDRNETEIGLGSSDEPFVCPYEYNGIDVLLPHPTDCGKYLQCDHGQPFEKLCPAGLYFNALISVCDWPWNVFCADTSTNNPTEVGLASPNNTGGEKIVCPSDYTGYDILLPHPTNCTKYLQCVHGQPVERYCPSGLYFNNKTDSCDWPWKVDCTTTEQIDTSENEEAVDGGEIACPSDFNGNVVLLPHPSDCTKFLQCIDGKLLEEDCPIGLLFNNLTGGCDWPWNVACNTIIEDQAENNPDVANGNSNQTDIQTGSAYVANGVANQTENIPCSVDYNGYDLVQLPHPTNCSKFLFCQEGQLVEADCPDGFYFNVEINGCDWDWNMNCNNIDV